MGKFIRQSLAISVKVVLIFVAVSVLNMKTKGKYQALKKADIINIQLTKIAVTDITKLFIKAKHNRLQTIYIVVHCDAIDEQIFEQTPLFEIYNYHKKKYHTIAYHYYISKGGKLYQMHHADEKTSHAKKVNSVAVSVCLEGNFDKEYLKERQYASLIKTLLMLKKKYPNARIIGHCDVSDKTCPGTNINMKEVRETVENFHILNTHLNYEHTTK